jgi:Rad3-related DNA helicase
VIETEAILLERERELAELMDAVAAAQRGRGRIVLVEAAAGLGKTSLLMVAAQAARAAGFTLMRARATELERDFAYGCVRQLLEPVVAKAVGPERDRLFEGAAALSKPLFDPKAAPQPLSSADCSFAMLHGLYWLLANLAEERPVALSVDDRAASAAFEPPSDGDVVRRPAGSPRGRARVRSGVPSCDGRQPLLPRDIAA